MTTHFEENLQHDIDQVRDKVIDMGGLVEEALRGALHTVRDQNRQTAYAVVLKDRHIDDLENELDHLCLRFLVRQQPAAGHLRLAYGVIKINSQLERVGDYAEAIARQWLILNDMDGQIDYAPSVVLIETTIRMIHNAVQAFADNDAALAAETLKMEKDRIVDHQRAQIVTDLIQQHSEGHLSSEMLVPLMTIANRCERIGDQAGNISEEILYVLTGEDRRHDEEHIFRVLFVDGHDACRNQMAEGISNALGMNRISFASAGLKAGTIDPKTVQFMAQKGIDISQQTSSYIDQILHPEDYHVIISMSKETEGKLLPSSSKTVSMTWHIEDPSTVEGSEEAVQDAYENTFQSLDTHIKDFVQAMLGLDINREEDR
jgi:phosphate transport system protein